MVLQRRENMSFVAFHGCKSKQTTTKMLLPVESQRTFHSLKATHPDKNLSFLSQLHAQTNRASSTEQVFQKLFNKMTSMTLVAFHCCKSKQATHVEAKRDRKLFHTRKNFNARTTITLVQIKTKMRFVVSSSKQNPSHHTHAFLYCFFFFSLDNRKKKTHLQNLSFCSLW